MTSRGRIPITQDVISLGIQPLGLCWDMQGPRPDHVNHPYTVDCFGLLYCPIGGVFANRHGERQRLASASVCLLLPGVEHCYGPDDGDPWQEWLLFFDGWMPRRLLEEGRLLATHVIAQLGDRDAQWLQIRHLVGDGRAEDCCPLVAECLHALSWTPHRQRRQEGDHPVWTLADAMAAEPAQAYDFETWALTHGIGYTAFRQAFARLVGRSPHQYLIHERLNLAARLLTDPMPVQDVCRAVGYADPAHFSRLFKKHFGKSPRTFQQSHAVMRR